MFCSKCGKELRNGDTYCPNCGHKVNGGNGVSMPNIDLGKLQEKGLAVVQSSKNLYLVLMSAIMVFMMFSPLFKLLKVETIKTSGWTYEVSQVSQSYNMIQLSGILFNDFILGGGKNVFVFIGALFAIALSIAISVCSFRFLKEVYDTKSIYSSDYISYNVKFSIGLAISLLVFIFGVGGIGGIISSSSLEEIRISVSFLMWIIVGLALLSELVLYKMYVAEIDRENNAE